MDIGDLSKTLKQKIKKNLAAIIFFIYLELNFWKYSNFFKDI